jgi:DNA-binding GntR family transcriptional regulator
MVYGILRMWGCMARGPLGITPKAQPLTIQEVVYRELEDAILSGKLPPGQKLIAGEISRMMDVSRIPVREAMGRLEARGLIATRPKWGSVVNELSRENLEEVSEIRILLESQAAAKAAGRVDASFLAKLEKAQVAFAKARKGTVSDRLLKTNRKFHFLIYEQANSPMLLNIIKQLWNRVSPYYHIMFRQALDRSPTVGVSYHEHIFESLAHEDEDAVQHWLKADLIDSTQYILNLFDRFSALLQG